MPTTLSTDVNRPYVPASGGTVTAEIDVEPGTQTEPVARHVALCIDTSGSMDGEKLSRARDGASWVFGLLEPDDHVSVVAFDTDASVVMPPTRWGDTGREAAMDRVEALSAGGKTDMYGGLELASEAFADDGGDRAVRRILLLSDGKDSTHDPADFHALAKDIDERGVRVQAAGVGEDYDEETIRTLGTTARGTWRHLETAGDIQEFFGDAVESAKSVVAPDARLELDLGAGVTVSEVYRALPQAQEADVEWEGNVAVVKLPDLAERERQRVVCKFTAPERDLGESTLASVRLSAAGETATDRLTVEYTDDNAKLARNNEDVSLDHKQTVIRTELGRGNVERAETELEKMTKIHGEDAAEVQEAERQTELVKEGGRAEQHRATKLVDDEDGLQG